MEHASWETRYKKTSFRVLKEISLLLRTNDLRLPKFLDLSNKKSQKMWIKGNAEKESDFKKLVQSFESNTTVEELNMSSNNLDSNAIKILFQVLDNRDTFMKDHKINNRLKIVNLSNNNLGTKSAAEEVRDYVRTTKLVSVCAAGPPGRRGSKLPSRELTT